jgi:hypothetical protein
LGVETLGLLKDFKLNEYDCNVYVETGTGRANTLSKAIQYFDRCYSVDIDEIMVFKARIVFSEATIEHGLSTNVLEKWLKNDLSQNDRVFFFLDAHFPGADHNGAKYDITSPNAVPLKEELLLIKQYRPDCKDYIMCDDARIYTIANFESGNVEWLQVPGGFNFINEIFPDAKISLNLQEEGYFIIDKR